jgi:hypothetical protein
VKGRWWLVVGAAIGIAVAAGHLPYLAGAARSLTNTAEKLVDSGAKSLIRASASEGAPRRVTLGLSGLIAALLPGVTALLLVIAARGSLRLRALVALLVVALGAASFFYQPHGEAAGVLILALVVAALAVALTGPLVAAPLAGAAALIGAEFLPELVTSSNAVSNVAINDVHIAIFNHPGTPFALRVAMLIVAAVPFAAAARLIVAR